MRRFLVIALLFLLPLQALHAATAALCTAAWSQPHPSAGGHGHTGAVGDPAGHHHHAGHSAHQPHGAPEARGAAPSVEVTSDADPQAASAQAATPAMGDPFDGCCHLGVALPMQHAVPGHPTPGARLLASRDLHPLSHTDGGPFRPPRLLLA